MKVGEIYIIDFPYEQGQGHKYRPVLVLVLTSKPYEFIGLKITKTPREESRVEINYWKEAGLDCKSYVQCDYYSVIKLKGEAKLIGELKQSDYKKVLLKFNEFYQILD